VGPYLAQDSDIRMRAFIVCVSRVLVTPALRLPPNVGRSKVAFSAPSISFTGALLSLLDFGVQVKTIKSTKALRKP